MTVNNTPRLMYFWASAILLGLGFSGPALSAQSDQDSACHLIQDNMQRLGCFDRLFAEQNNEQAPENIQGDPTPRAQSVIENAKRETDDIDKRAQALINPSGKADVRFSKETSRVPATTKRQVIANTAHDSFGSQALKTNTQDAVNEIQSTVSAINENALGVASLILSNGQVWRHTDQSRLTIRQGDIVTIEKGVLGAFYLSEVDSNRRIRVRRTQ